MLLDSLSPLWYSIGMNSLSDNPVLPLAPATHAPIVVTSHRVYLPAQNRVENVPAMHTQPDDEDAACWWMKRGEAAIFQTVIENKYRMPSRFAHGGLGYYAIDADPATVTDTASYTWTGKTWRRSQ